MNLAYLAGFFDGEGCIWLQKRVHCRPSFLMAVVNTEKRPLLEFKRRWGGTISVMQDFRPRLAPRRIFRWTVSGAKARKAALAMQRYIVVKADQFRMWLRAWDEITPRATGDRRHGREAWFRAKLSAMKRK